ncbi:MAG: acyltransferase [Corallococcus sp.]|nr:acyltransferase [Corallococcus sp.]MCM1359009.1 acyltransferase [Corallococcus sp.]MCM1394998.1 acyltransferase [Corallococcus sp.]
MSYGNTDMSEESMGNSKSSRIVWLDIFKIFLIILVIGIHFYDDFRFAALYRMAVPAFFMISGYFLYSSDKDTEYARSKRFVIGSAKYLLLGLLIYVIYDFVMTLVYGDSLADMFENLFYDSFFQDFFVFNKYITSGYHLWFLIALFVVSLIHFVIVKFGKTKWYYFIVPICFAVSLFFGGYLDLFDRAVRLYYRRNALFMGLPAVATGYLLGKHKNALCPQNRYKWIYLVLGIAFFFLQYFENMIVEMEYYVTSVLCSACLVVFFTNLKPTENTAYYKYFGRNMSFYLYVIHLAAGELLQKHSKISDAALVFLTFAVSFAVYEIAYWSVFLMSYLVKKFSKYSKSETAQS